MSPKNVPVVELDWGATHRLIPSRFPPIGLFERVADPLDLEVVYAIEALTNPRLRQEVGEISLVPPGERMSGPGSSAVMAAFTHLNPMGSRFSDGSHGVYYAGRSLETAVREVSFHQARFLAATREPPIEIDMRCYKATVKQPLHDLRGLVSKLPAVYDPDSYAASQAMGARLRALGSWGVAYDSVRDAGGECVGLFRPLALSPAVQGPHVALQWNGVQIGSWYVKSELRTL
ncbi:RES family NAD+ phosphorylase [Aquincola sp. S2]|uniref:RES family NAD+ phosphorylase n=1 Tax=Pseudaquabacterium terrae TaxID=2732868 RepID=A0ABX2EHS6_9BURK|nr:RES family NAD+ phosphorylase [Aquabacterium terrae]NRF68180.1 RES family NAD+ phosphorylase [Aquabacterium terrae]